MLAVGYAARPIGSVIFGHIGDRIGRKTALMISVLMMGAGSLAIAVLPIAYDQIGVTAALLLVAIRIVQGISVAGEYTASGVLLVEQARPGRKALTGAWVAFAMMWGCVLGSAVPAAFSSVLSSERMTDWGWRLPFLIGARCSGFQRDPAPSSDRNSRRGRMRPPNPHRSGWSLRDHFGLILQMVLLLIPTSVIYS